MSNDRDQQDLREELKRVAVGLKRSDVPFALRRRLAVWARGGPEPSCSNSTGSM